MKNVRTVDRAIEARTEESADVVDRWRELREVCIQIAADWSNNRSSSEHDAERIAQNICATVVHTLWRRRTEDERRWFRSWPKSATSTPFPVARFARDAARILDGMSVIEASYLVGTLYTALLPPRMRAARGAHYTPPLLAERLLDLAAGAGVDWSSVKALDPACGGGAFLVPLADRILHDHRTRERSPDERLDDLESRLTGIEIDPFAAWMSRVFLQLLAYPISLQADRGLSIAIHEGDALERFQGWDRQFDLVIANPPFGRVGLSSEQRLVFERSLYGHANLYGLFLDLALRWRRRGGLVAFITPTSFLGGQYFSRLRDLLWDQAPPLAVDFIEPRTGIFDAVQQETCLTVFGHNKSRSTVVHFLRTFDRSLRIDRAGAFTIDGSRGAPWLLPRSPLQASIIARANRMKTRLHHLGYKGSTGPLVWNRHKNQLRKRRAHGRYPLIWAEAVRPNAFNFAYRIRAGSAFVEVLEGQSHLLCSDPCVLIQRTTSKEQMRRLVACAVPPEFIELWEAFVVENHVNVVRPIGPDAVAPEALAAVLNTWVVDQIFRCLSGTVAVSVTELHALPLPPRAVFDRVMRALEDPADRGKGLSEIERIVAEAYGLNYRELDEIHVSAVA